MRPEPVISPVSQETARQYFEQGKIHYDAGEFVQAVVALEAAAQSFESQADWPSLAATWMNLGRSHFAIGHLNTALDQWRLAEILYRDRLSDSVGATQSRVYQAQAQQELGLHLQACQTLTLTLQIDPELCVSRQTLTGVFAVQSASDFSTPQVEAWQSLGDVLRQMGRLEDSQILLADLAPAIAPSPQKDAIVLALGNTYRALGDRVRDRALPQKFNFMPWRCQVNATLPRAASAYYEQAEAAYRSLGSANSVALRTQAQLNRLRLLSELGSLDDSAKAALLAQAIDFSSLPPNRNRVYGRIQAARSQICLQEQLQQVPTWETWAQQITLAIQEATQAGDQRALSYALGNLGGLYEYRAWGLAQQAQPGAAQDWRQQALMATREALYEAQPGKFADIAYRWQWQQGRLLKAQGKRGDAIAAYKAAIQTLETVRGDLLAINSDVQFSFRDNVEPIYRELVALLLSQRGDGASQVELQQLLAESLFYVESLQLAELENFLQCNVETLGSVSQTRLSEQVNPAATLLDRLEQILQSDPQSALIYPIVLADRIALIAKRPGMPFQYSETMVNPLRVENTLNQLQRSLVDPSATLAVRETAGQVYEWLIQPFESVLETQQTRDESEIKNLVFVLDGAFRNIPMSVLYDVQQERYLLQRYSIALASGLQLLDTQPMSTPARALLGGLSQPPAIDGPSFIPLQNVPQELTSIEQAISGQILLDASFTQPQLQRELESTAYSIVHLATHGKFSSDPEETFLVLWDQLLQAADLNDLLRVNTPNQSAAIDLLVLSACETASGDKRAALGLAGLALRAGARSTLATLWQVDDASTAELMRYFYDNLRNAPDMTKAEALQQAQLSLWRVNSQNWDVPRYWAPYVLVGNWL
jgi:CHAT domain-containing protein